MKWVAIEQYKSEFSVSKMCKVLKLNPASYYSWQKTQQKKLERIQGELGLVKKIEEKFLESNKTYGYRPIKRALSDENIEISEYKVRRIMRENGFYPETNKKYKPSKREKGDGRYFENLINQDFTTSERNQVWVGDITYIKTVIGWVYLAAVIDLYNREVIGYAVSKKINAELAKQALVNAIAQKGVKEGLIFHSDRGSQYASNVFQKKLSEYRITGSMSKPGCPYDNSCMESFFATLKKERIYRKQYGTMEEVKQDMFQYIELFYNRRRLHSVLGYMSPVDYRLKYDGKKPA